MVHAKCDERKNYEQVQTFAAHSTILMRNALNYIMELNKQIGNSTEFGSFGGDFAYLLCCV